MNKKTAWVIGGSVLVVVLLLAAAMPFLSPARMTTSVDGYGVSATMMNLTQGEVASKGEMMPVVFNDLQESAVPPQPIADTAGQTAAEVDQKIIKTGFLDLTVDDVGETVSKLSALAVGKGGFVQESSVSEREDGTHYGNVTVRVPSDQFETAVKDTKSYAVSVVTESSQGQDVTEQYTDLEAQLRNAQAQEAEYLKILAKATTVDEILQVQSYLSNVRYTIESLQGRIQYLKNQTTYSTISITLSEETSVHIPTKDFRFGATVREAGQALIAIFQNLASAAVWIIIVGGGILIPLGLIVWGIVKIATKTRRR